MSDISFYFWSLVGLLIIGFIFGQISERRHFKSLRKREKELADILIFSDKNIPKEFSRNQNAHIVLGSVVLSKDYFQGIVAAFRKLIGGSIKGYETLLVRARREAILRLKEEAKALGAKAVFNVKFETSSISKGRKNLITVEVFAYGTAVS